MASNLGPGVSRILSAADRQFASVVFRANRPPLDSELNLMSTMDAEARAEEVRSRVASGWLLDESDPRSDFKTDPNYSNTFFFGRNVAGEYHNVSWAVVNGWLVPVSGTATGSPPLAANNADTWNRINLNPPSTSTGGNRAEFVFLEVWLAAIDVDPASPAIAPGKPQRGSIYRFGNVETGFDYLADELIDPEIQKDTTRRVQVQYRLRVVSDVNLTQYPEGFDPTLVHAQGLLSAPGSVAFANMRGPLGDPGLWRAGTGDPTTFGTVDGYVYAIPLSGVFRRNAGGFSDVGNMAGGFNRNSVATTRAGARIFTSPIALTGPMATVDTTFTLTSIAGTILESLNAFGEAYFKLDQEIVRVTQVVQNTPTNFTVTVNRGQLQTTVRSHLTGATLVPYTTRPDGLFADQIASTDILDLRHSVADKFDYTSLLRSSLVDLLRGNLRTTWKRYGSTNSAGPVVLYGDRITDASVSVGGLTRLDAPDGNRRLFSDAAVLQRFTAPVSAPTNAAALNANLTVVTPPYNINVTWDAAAPSHGAGNRNSGTYSTWWNGDRIRISKSTFVAGIPAGDADQVRFVLPTEDIDAVVLRFEGMTTDPAGGLPSNAAVSPTATNPTLTTPIAGQRVLKHGQGLTVSLHASGDLLIAFSSGTVDTELQEFIDALQGSTVQAYAQSVVLHVEFAVLYGAGRGLSHRPDFVHAVHYKGSPSNTSRVLLRGGLTDRSLMAPTYLNDSPHVQTGNQRNLARTSEVMVDPGSKTVCVAPYRQIQAPAVMARTGTGLNWYNNATQFQGAMPLNAIDGVTPLYTSVDPLDLFYNGNETRYVEIPLQYLPKPGLHHTPIQAVSTTIFSSGINFGLMSKEGPNSATSNYNVNLVSYPAAAGYYIVTPQVGETYGNSSGSLSIFGKKYQNPNLRSKSGGAFQGIMFPPYLAPARITGVYLRSGSAVVPTSSPFDNNRAFVGGVGKDVNLLSDSYDGPTFLIDVNDQGDVFFVLNADALDLSKAPGGTQFTTADFLIECTLFGYDRGFLQTNGRVCVAKSSGGGSSAIAAGVFVTASDSKVGTICPAPLSSDSTNNEVTIYYSHVPYQGDAFGTQNAYSDDFYRKGPMTLGESQSVALNPLGPISTLAYEDKRGYEVLSSMSFVTSLGTGRLSGSTPIPLLSATEAPLNPPDFVGSCVDVARKYSYNRVGSEDWDATKFPVRAATATARPALAIGALSEVYDNEVNTEYAGCTSRLPLGAYFRDKDFLGKTLYQSRSTSNIGTISLGTLSFLPFEASSSKLSPGNSTWEGTEFVVGQSSGVAGSSGEKLIIVNGSQGTSSTVSFKTTRGGAAYSATTPWPGSVVSSKFPKARPNSQYGAVLMGTAYLVRSQPEDSGLGEVHAGQEIQMVVVTHAVPAYFRDTDILHSANGTNEGYTAVDRFRIHGRPLERRREVVNTSVLPTERPLFINRVFDDPTLFGSSDVSLVTQKQATLTVAANGQTVFALPGRPLDPATVQLFLNGVKLQYGVDYTVTGSTNQVLTYSGVTNPTLNTNDILEVFYVLF